MDTGSTYRWTRASIALVTALAAGFWVWFQLTKQPAVAAVDPFAEDPWDLVGSLAVQGAAALAILSLARVVHLGDAGPGAWTRDRLRFAWRGGVLAVGAIWLTLAVDTAAILITPDAAARAADAGFPGWLVLGGLAMLGIGATLATISLVVTWRHRRRAYPGLPDASAFEPGMLGQAILDLVHLAMGPLRWAATRNRRLGARLDALGRITRASRYAPTVERAWTRAMAPPGWTVTLAATATGAGLVAVDFLREGPPSSATTALLIVTIFVAVESAAALGAFLAFGAFLGLRPPIRRRD
jgi:hypothetical protein